MGRNYEDRKKQLLNCIPDVLDYETLLYIGARRGQVQMLDFFIDAFYTIDIVEIWQPNVDWLKGLEGIRKVSEGDVRNILKMSLKLYDVVMWWHGPEHVYPKELRKILDNLKTLSKKLAIVACPWGVNYQGKRKANIHEEHVSSIYPEIFKGFGWKFNTIGKPDVPGSNLLAWSKQ